MSTQRKIVSNSAVIESKKFKLDDVLEPDFLNFISVPPLENMAIVKIATSLLNQTIIRDKIRQLCIDFDPEFHETYWDNSFENIKRDVINMFSQLPLPGVLKNKVSYVIVPIVNQIRGSLLNDLNDIDYFDSICWTNEGTIDKIKTLKQLIKENKGKHTTSIFHLSCQYCLEEGIAYSWAKLPTDFNVILRNKMNEVYDWHLMAYWIYAFRNKLNELLIQIKCCDPCNIYNCDDSIYKNMVNLSIFNGNDLALRYFWGKLTDKEISSNLTEWIHDAALNKNHNLDIFLTVNGHGNVLYYLISKVSDREEQKKILTNNQNVVLSSLFFDWPWQRYLLPTIEMIWECIYSGSYAEFLSNISQFLKNENIAEEISSRLWRDIPMNFKKKVMRILMNPFYEIFYNLLSAENIGTLKSFLEYANVEELEYITFSLVEHLQFDSIIEANKIDLFEKLFLSKLSETNVNLIKEKIFSNHGEKVCRNWIYKNDWIMLEKFLKWACNNDQIDTFKKKKIDKKEIAFMILYHQGDYELLNEFMDWCFDSKEEILQFKKEVLAYMPRIVEIGEKDWHRFDMFLDWCFDSEDEINNFKLRLLKSDEFQTLISDSIKYRYNFEFFDKLLGWCCNSKEELEKFKAGFVLSPCFRGVLQRFVSNHKIYHSEWNNWELVKKLLKLFSPLKEDTKNKLKMQISSFIDFEKYWPDYSNTSVKINMIDLFCVLDDDSYNLGDNSIYYYRGFSSDDEENKIIRMHLNILRLSELDED